MLNLQTPINSLGYGVAGTNIAEALIRSNVKLHVHPIGQPDTSLASPKLIEAMEHNITNHSPSWPLIKVWHQNHLMDRIGNGKFYGFPIFELDKFSQQEKYHLSVPDDLIVCSNWAKGVIEDQCGRSAHIVPLGVDRKIFHESSIPRKNGPYKFFTIGKLEYRKGHDFIVKCFNKAFTSNDEVELHMMVNNSFISREIVQQWYGNFKNSKLGSRITLYNPVKDHSDVASFINSCDCGLFPARAEGWNLELLESMACGKPVIATNYSAHTEFCDSSNSYLIDIESKEKAYDKMGGMWFNGQGSWAELDFEQEDQMIEHMRQCYKERPSNIRGVETSKKFSWDNSARKIIDLI